MMQAIENMNRFLFSLYIICLVHAQVPQNCVNSMVVNDIESGGGGAMLAKVIDHHNEDYYQHQQQQHHLRHMHNQQNHNHHHHHNNHRHHNVHHHQPEAAHHVDAGHHNDVEIGHTQPNMVSFFFKWTTIFESHNIHTRPRNLPKYSSISEYIYGCIFPFVILFWYSNCRRFTRINYQNLHQTIIKIYEK